MTTWINIATTPIPSVELAVLSGTHRYRVRGVCATGEKELFPMGVWVTR